MRFEEEQKFLEMLIIRGIVKDHEPDAHAIQVMGEVQSSKHQLNKVGSIMIDSDSKDFLRLFQGAASFSDLYSIKSARPEI